MHPVVLQLVDVVGNTHLVPIGMGIGKINRLWIVVCHQHVKPFAGSVVLIHTDCIAIDRWGNGWCGCMRNIELELHFIYRTQCTFVILSNNLQAVQARRHYSSTGPLGRGRRVLAAGRGTAKATIFRVDFGR